LKNLNGLDILYYYPSREGNVSFKIRGKENVISLSFKGRECILFLKNVVTNFISCFLLSVEYACLILIFKVKYTQY